MIRLLAIARNAFIETIRQPIYGILILVTFLVLVLDVPLSDWTMGRGAAEYEETDQIMLINLGLSTLLISGLIVSAFSAAGTLAREIEDRTILTILAKPVPRSSVVLGKFLGLAVALAIYYVICSAAFLMTVRHGVMPTASHRLDYPVIVLGLSALALAILTAVIMNYGFGWNFAATAVMFGLALLLAAMLIIAFVGKGWKFVAFGDRIPPPLLPAMLLGLLGVMVFAAVAVAASTRLGQVMTLLVCVGFFVVGTLSQYLFGRFAGQALAARVAYAAWPNLNYYYALDAMVTGQTVSGYYVGLSALYAVLNVGAILAVGMALFQRRELEAQGGESAPRLVSVLAWAGRAGAVLAAISAMVLPSYLPMLQGLAAGVGLLALAVLAWLVSGWFGRGVQWTYWLVLAGSVIALGAWLVRVVEDVRRQSITLVEPVSGAVVAGLVVLVLLLPSTRQHFGFVRKARAA